MWQELAKLEAWIRAMIRQEIGLSVYPGSGDHVGNAAAVEDASAAIVADEALQTAAAKPASGN